MRVLLFDRKVQIINGLCNGMSLRACSRVFQTHRTAIQRLLLKTGENCNLLSKKQLVGLDCKRLELDELWTFCGKKESRLNLEEKKNLELGDQYVFFAVDHDTKLVPSWFIGKRNADSADIFIGRLKDCLNGCRPHISTDAWAGYQGLIARHFGGDIDHGTIIKLYREPYGVGRGRYAPPKVKEVRKRVESGTLDEGLICTSIIERNNLTVRTMQRRLTRLSLGFSRKWSHLKAAIDLHFTYYNFCWVPRTIKTTPAVAAGLVTEPWEIERLIQ